MCRLLVSGRAPGGRAARNGTPMRDLRQRVDVMFIFRLPSETCDSPFAEHPVPRKHWRPAADGH
ncbi:hypothetical protein ASE68_04465 [Agromyces sp. Leaf222]|nr:hypothetical protein ASE68_04465 [Agromyces sp. Leaf222]